MGSVVYQVLGFGVNLNQVCTPFQSSSEGYMTGIL